MVGVYATLLRQVVLPLGERLRGSCVLGNLKRLEETQWWKPEQIKQLQQQKLNRLLGYAYANVPYYREIFEERGLTPDDIQAVTDLSKLPILTKEVVRKTSPDRIVSKDIQRLSPLAVHSSGSTGEPFHFYVNRQAYDANLAAMFRYWRAIGYDFGKPWVRISLWPHTKLVDRVYDRLLRCTYIRFFKVDEQILLEQIDRIRKAEPVIIRGYASAVYLLAKAARDHNINDIRPEAVITTGDILFQHYRELIEDQFVCPVYDVYGGESMIVAGQCEHSAYHISAEGVIVEFLKGDGTPAAPGELGSVVLTNLNNFAMPFIRYQIGDLGIPSKTQCPCGRGLPTMDSIQGRDSDIVVTPDDKYLIVHFFTGLFEYVNVNQFQVVQHEIDRIEIKLVKNDRFGDADIDYILGTIRKGGGAALKVELTFVEAIPVTRSGKRRFVISEVGRERFGL